MLPEVRGPLPHPCEELAVKEPRISVVASEALLEALIAAAKALRASRRKEAITPAVLNALIVQVSTARGTFEHAQRAAAKAAETPAGGV